MEELIFESFVNSNPATEVFTFNNSVVVAGESVDTESLFGHEKRGFKFKSMEATVQVSNRVIELNTRKFQQRTTFDINKNTWVEQTGFLANNNFDNAYFKEIIEMGEDAVPMIIEELKKGPTLLVYALDKIYPNTVVCEGYVPLKPLCDLWLDILTQNVKV